MEQISCFFSQGYTSDVSGNGEDCKGKLNQDEIVFQVIRCTTSHFSVFLSNVIRHMRIDDTEFNKIVKMQ